MPMEETTNRTKIDKAQDKVPDHLYQLNQLNLGGQHGALLEYMANHHLPDWQFSVQNLSANHIVFDDEGGTRARINLRDRTVTLGHTMMKKSAYHTYDYATVKEVTSYVCQMLLLNKGGPTPNGPKNDPTTYRKAKADSYIQIESRKDDVSASIIKLHDDMDAPEPGTGLHGIASYSNRPDPIQEAVYLTI